MRLRVSDPVGRDWLSNLIYVLLEGDEYEYAFTLHNISVIGVRKPFATFNGLAVPAAIGLTDAGRLILLLYIPIVSRLSYRSQLAILKHELLHVIEGHMSSYGVRLIEDYGSEISNIAKDIYVNQRLSSAEVNSLNDDGLPLQTWQVYGFKPGLSSEEYCQLLQSSKGKAKMPPPGEIKHFVDGDEDSSTGGGGNKDESGEGGSGEQSDDSDQSDSGDQSGQGSGGQSKSNSEGKPGDSFEGQGQYRPSEVFDLSKDEGVLANQATQEVLRSVTETLEARGKQWNKQRGFGGADQSAFVEASKRQSPTPWHYFLRALESRMRAEQVVPTRSRLSRRNPNHMGRVRRYGLDAVFMIDTSGSMGAEQLSLVDAELRGMHARGAHVKVIHCDSEVAKIEDYSPFLTMDKFYGRGGTDFSPALLALRDLYPYPSMFVGFTDGYGSIHSYVAAVVEERGQEWYNEFVSRSPTTMPEGIEAIWLLPEGCLTPEEFKTRICPWGQAIVVPADSGVRKR